MRNNSIGSSLDSAEAMNDGSSNRSICSDQYCEYSTNEVGDKMKGGAVNDDKSPLYEAMDLMNEVQEADDMLSVYDKKSQKIEKKKGNVWLIEMFN